MNGIDNRKQGSTLGTDFFVSAIGQQILLETVDGSKFEGILATLTAQEVGLKGVLKLSVDTTDLLPRRSKLVRSMICPLEKVLAISYYINEDAGARNGFTIDNEYHDRKSSVHFEEADFEEWQDDEGSTEKMVALDDLASDTKSRGWKAEEMFKQNVKSDFLDDLSQYRTAEPRTPQNEDEAKKLDLIVKAIKSNAKSRHNAKLENDDEERDLDKITDFSEVSTDKNKNKEAEVEAEVEKSRADDEIAEPKAPQIDDEDEARKPDRSEKAIESSEKCRHNAKLENDDEERDLEKITTVSEVSTDKDMEAEVEVVEARTDERSHFKFNPEADSFVPKSNVVRRYSGERVRERRIPAAGMHHGVTPVGMPHGATPAPVHHRAAPAPVHHGAAPVPVYMYPVMGPFPLQQHQFLPSNQFNMIPGPQGGYLMVTQQPNSFCISGSPQFPGPVYRF